MPDLTTLPELQAQHYLAGYTDAKSGIATQSSGTAIDIRIVYTTMNFPALEIVAEGLLHHWRIPIPRVAFRNRGYSIVYSSTHAYNVAKVLAPHCLIKRERLHWVIETHEAYQLLTAGADKEAFVRERLTRYQHILQILEPFGGFEKTGG